MSPALDDAYAHCRQVVSERAKNFAYGFLLLPAERRQGLEAIYAYCRLADDLADDEGLSEPERARRLADLRLRLRAALPLPGDPPAASLAPDRELDPVMLALQDTARRFGVERHDLDLVAQGCEQDLEVRRYATFADLYDYCYLVASAVGLACLEVFGYQGDRALLRGYAADLGIAMQLTNIIRDVKEDLERDRIYLPQEDLVRFGLTEDDLRAGQMDTRLRAMLGFQVTRARDYFARGARLAEFVPRATRSCPLALAGIYQALLDAIDVAGCDVFSRRVSLAAPHKLALLGQAFGRALLPG